MQLRSSWRGGRVEGWLTVIIVVLIIAIVLDGLRRMRIAKRENIRISKNAHKLDLDEDLAVSSSEFPSGGARIAAHRAEEEANSLNENVRKSFESARVTKGVTQRIPEQVSLNLEQSVPMLMDSVDDVDEQRDEESSGDSYAAARSNKEEAREPTIGSLDVLDDEYENVSSSQRVSEAADLAEQSQPQPKTSKADTAKQEEAEPEYREPDEVLIMNVMAKSGHRFAGADLLDALMAEKLKFGDMEIFHRYRDNDGDAPIIFSLANMVVPGTFNLAAMADFETPGVSIFLSLPVACESLEAYNDMAQTACNLAQRLDGELKDENRSVMTSQTIEHGRQRVIEYERKRKLARV